MEQSDNILRVGLGIFDRLKMPDVIAICLEANDPSMQHYITFLSNLSWTISNGMFNKVDWGWVFDSMLQSKCIQFYCQSNPPPSNKILKTLSPPFYSQLQTFYLCSNGLTSIQAISFFNFPSLQVISFNNNLITCSKPLNKLNNRNMISINLDQNSIQKLQLERVKIKSAQYSMAQIFGMVFKEQDASILAKFMQITRNLRHAIPLYPSKKIRQPKVSDAIFNKYHDR